MSTHRSWIVITGAAIFDFGVRVGEVSPTSGDVPVEIANW